MSRFDSAWISQKLNSADRDWMDDYLQGKPCVSQPIWELVAEGRALVFGTELRERAYETVKRTWPRSLALLELARLGVELDSDLGLITAMVIGDSAAGFRVRYVMNFVDATNEAFLDRVAAFGGPKNARDLTPTSELVRPDLTPSEFALT